MLLSADENMENQIFSNPAVTKHYHFREQFDRIYNMQTSLLLAKFVTYVTLDPIILLVENSYQNSLLYLRSYLPNVNLSGLIRKQRKVV